MTTLITGTPGSGKTSLVEYANSENDKRFVDSDSVDGLCEWREFATGEILGLVTEHKESGKDDWYAKYGWYWRTEILKRFLAENPDVILCGSAENTVECYHFFDQIILLKKNEKELLSNLASPERINPFGKTPEQRKNFMNWQDYLISSASKFNPVILDGNSITDTYKIVCLKVAKYVH